MNLHALPTKFSDHSIGNATLECLYYVFLVCKARKFFFFRLSCSREVIPLVRKINLI